MCYNVIVREVLAYLRRWRFELYYGIIIYTEVVLIVKLITRKASSEARQRADRIIRDVHKLLGKEYRFFCRPIGSQTRRCIVQDKNGKYDLDYQIVLTQNSKGDLDPTSIKKRFLRQS